VRNTAQK